MPITIAIFFFLSTIQHNRQRILLIRITGNAIPIKEKNAVRSGDTYHAGKEKQKQKDGYNSDSKENCFYYFFDHSSMIVPFFISCQHQIADAFLLPLGCYIQIVLVCQVLHLSSWILLFFYNCSRNLFRLF